MNDDFQLLSHYDLATWPEWGSAPRGPLIECDMAHKGELLDTVLGPDPVTGKPRVYYIVRCELCIITHVWPLPSPEALARYYTEEFYQVDKTDYVARYEQDRAWWEECVHGPILEQCLEELGESVPDPVRFLEIGAGPGIALDVAKQRFGWDTWAVEPCDALIQSLADRGHTVTNGTLESAQPHLQPIFDILYLYEVLEHQSTPDDFLLRCWDLLRPGGLIVVVVPNEFSPLQMQAKKQLGLESYWLAPPQHLNMFSPKQLQLLLRRCGFKIVDARGTYPLEQFLLNGRCYVGDDAIGRACHRERMQEELSDLADGKWLERENIYRENLKKRIGREMVFIARKIK